MTGITAAEPVRYATGAAVRTCSRWFNAVSVDAAPDQLELLAAEVSRRMRDFYAGLTTGLTDSELQAFASAALRIIANHDAMTGS